MNRSVKLTVPFSVMVRNSAQVTARSDSSPWGQIVQIGAAPNSDNSGSIDLKIEGVAGNVNSVFCTITTGAYILASDPAAPGVDGSFTCSATGLAVQGAVLSVVLADPDSQTALDRISVNLGVGSVLSVPTGMTPAEIPFAAGHPDRIIETRSIAVLSESRATLGGKNVRWASFGPLLVPIDQIPQGAQQIEASGSSGTSGGLPDRKQIENSMTEVWAVALARQIRDVAATSDDRKLKPANEPLNSVRLYADSRLSKQFLEEISSDEKLQSDLQSWLNGTLQVFGKVDWLGVIFHERVRARPVQAVVGETVQVLWVAPGDTVQITQKFSTKRSTEFESVTDQETEQQLDFDSTWSTDWSRGATSTTTTSIGGNETLGAGPFPDLPITVSSGLNFNQSFSDTADEKLQLTQQVSAKQSAKAREEHKVTVKRSADIQDESGVSRTTRNLNPGRSLSFEIKKMYRKDHLSFERFDAQLCLALTAIDPGREIRAQFLDGLAQLDPNNQSLYQCIYPGQAETVTKWFTFDNPNLATPAGTLIWNDVVWSKFGIAPQTQGLILLSQPTIEVKDWQWIQYSLGGAQDRNGTADGFSGAGGWISCDKAAVGTGAQNVDIAALLPRRISWRTRRIKFTVTSKWGPKDADMVNYTACCAGEYRRIRSEFSVDEVSALFERCRRLDRNSILHTIVEDHFLQLLPDGLNAAQMGEFERVRKYFDWDNAIIDPLPWWLMPDSANYYDAVRKALSALPFEEPFDQFIDPVMTAAMARVYLPIRQGFEQAAVDFFSGRSGDLQNLISAFVRERNDRFGKYESRIPTANELCRPGYPTYTTQGQADWQNPWEKPPRKFEVLGVWSELLPIDGVHAEPFLSARTAVDESHSIRLYDGNVGNGVPAP